MLFMLFFFMFIFMRVMLFHMYYYFVLFMAKNMFVLPNKIVWLLYVLGPVPVMFKFTVGYHCYRLVQDRIVNHSQYIGYQQGSIWMIYKLEHVHFRNVKTVQVKTTLYHFYNWLDHVDFFKKCSKETWYDKFVHLWKLMKNKELTRLI